MSKCRVWRSHKKLILKNREQERDESSELAGESNPGFVNGDEDVHINTRRQKRTSQQQQQQQQQQQRFDLPWIYFLQFHYQNIHMKV